ncbi:MAG TPA: DUF1553 domain-containing protein [Abditibacteriaceae bacterium]|jgi:hypothetical protein
MKTRFYIKGKASTRGTPPNDCILFVGWVAVISLLSLSCNVCAAPDFVREVRPIFEKSCLPCHGPQKQKSGYRLDVRDIAFKGGDSGQTAIIAGDAKNSLLLHYISGEDKDMVMPPKQSNVPRLTPDQIATVRDWIEAGAIWPEAASAKLQDLQDWWSLKPITKPALPKTSTPDNNPMDAFIRAQLVEKGLTMSPQADPRTLCRRLYFDLIGLPPTPEELDAFEREFKADTFAYEKLVDRLLASPRYGERWARHWLDVVHYGDTHGYDKDQPRANAWPYRDYVIRAFNEDKPYARFVQEQVAGDVLYPGSRDGIEALGFIAAGPWDLIGHAEVEEDKTDGKVARHLDRDDMVGNVIGTFSSATIQCAQCHNHKFDPFSQEDYYALQAVFSALDRAEKTYDLDPRVAAERAALTARKSALQTKDKVLAERIKQAGGAELADLQTKIAAAQSVAAQGRRPEYGWHSNIEPKAETRKWVQVDLGTPIALDRVVLAGCFDDFNNIGAGFGFPPRFRVEASDNVEFGGTPIVIAAHDLEDYANPGTAPQSFVATGKTARYVRVTATKLAPRQNDFIFALAELQVWDKAGKNAALGAAVTSSDSIEAPVRWGRKNLTDDIYPAKSNEGLILLHRQRDELLARVTDEPTRRARAETATALADVTKQIAALPAERAVYAGTIHTGSGAFAGTGAKGGKPRPIFLLARGQVTSPGKEVGPGTLSAVTALPPRFEIPLDASEGARRGALAKWITDEKNPLTWRSIVNRVWQYHFGRGLVETSNDFGRMGVLPSHPELLDWLAGDFRDNGGSFKRLHKQIVTSAAYRQSSKVSNVKAAQLDSNNVMLWRQNRRKLDAESVRDATLAVSGTLDLTMGGPGWQDFVIERPEHSPHYKYDKADPADVKTWRRSIYRFIVRSQMQPFMTALDCADPSMRVDKRNESVSPAQALALLNNGFMVTQATHFAARVEKEAGPSPQAQVERAFRLAFGHAPSAEQTTKLTAFAKEHGLPNLSRLILNLNEFVFVD